MARKITTTIAAAALITLSVLSSAGPASAQNTDPGNPSITLEGGFGGSENSIPDTNVLPESGVPEVGAPPQVGGMQYETADGTPLNLQNADGTPLDISAIPPGGSVEVYGPGEVPGPGMSPPLTGAQQVPGSQTQTEVTAPLITPEEMAAVEKSQKEFGDMVLAVLIGISLILATAFALIVRSVRRRRRKKREALSV